MEEKKNNEVGSGVGSGVQRIIEKCEQYWNEPNICDAEIHAVLEFIHREARALLSLSSPIEPKCRWCAYKTPKQFGFHQAIEGDFSIPCEDVEQLELPTTRPTSQASSEIRERENGESNLPWLQRVKLDGYIACGQHGDRYGEDSQVWDLTCERCSQRFDAIVHVLEALAPSRQGATK